jgi:hypothetical protein
LICILIKNNKEQDLEEVLKELFENYQFDRDYEFDNYFEYDYKFIIKLLIYYKNKIKFSRKEFRLLLIKEKENKSNSIVNFNILNEYFYPFVPDIYNITTPIHIACNFNNEQIIKLLIQFGANINKKNSKGASPLTEMNNYDDNMLKLLINYGGDIHTVDYEGNTILHIAALYNLINIIKVLFDNKININKTNKNGNTPLHNACLRRHGSQA